MLVPVGGMQANKISPPSNSNKSEQFHQLQKIYLPPTHLHTHLHSKAYLIVKIIFPFTNAFAFAPSLPRDNPQKLCLQQCKKKLISFSIQHTTPLQSPHAPHACHADTRELEELGWVIFFFFSSRPYRICYVLNQRCKFCSAHKDVSILFYFFAPLFSFTCVFFFHPFTLVENMFFFCCYFAIAAATTHRYGNGNERAKQIEASASERFQPTTRTRR